MPWRVKLAEGAAAASLLNSFQFENPTPFVLSERSESKHPAPFDSAALRSGRTEYPGLEVEAV